MAYFRVPKGTKWTKDPETGKRIYTFPDGTTRTSSGGGTKKTRGRAADKPTGKFIPAWEREPDDDVNPDEFHEPLPPLILPSTAILDWAERIVAKQSIIPEPYNKERAEKALKIFDSLIVVDMIGKPRMGDVASPWQRALVAAIFGAYDEETKRQMIRKFFILLPKKNGKSPSAAFIQLTAFLMNERDGAEMGIIAPTKEVAGNSWKPLRAAILADEYLSDILKVQDHLKTVTHKKNESTIQVVAADSDTVAGKKWSIILIEELWLFGSRENADMMLMEITGGLAVRPEGFVMYISTQSDDPPSGVWASTLNYARKVRDGEIEDGSFLAVTYEFPKEMVKEGKHLDTKNWGIVNPNLGVSVDEEYIKSLYKEAQEKGEREIQGFLAKHLNIEIEMSQRSDRWAGADFWLDGTDEKLKTLDELISRSEVCVVGIDGGGLDDLLGLAVVGREKYTRKWLVWTHAWAHKIVLERRKDIAPNLYDFKQDGDLTIVDVPGEDVEQVADIVCLLRTKEVLAAEHCIGVDTAGIGTIVEKLETHGFVINQHIDGVGQGWRLNGAIKTVERLVAGGDLFHSGSRLMSWCVGNAKVKLVGNASTIEKQFSGSAKIDPLLAVFNAALLMGLSPEAPTKKLVLLKLG